MRGWGCASVRWRGGPTRLGLRVASRVPGAAGGGRGRLRLVTRLLGLALATRTTVALSDTSLMFGLPAVFARRGSCPILHLQLYCGVGPCWGVVGREAAQSGRREAKTDVPHTHRAREPRPFLTVHNFEGGT